MVRDKVRVICI